MFERLSGGLYIGTGTSSASTQVHRLVRGWTGKVGVLRLQVEPSTGARQKADRRNQEGHNWVHFIRLLHAVVTVRYEMVQVNGDFSQFTWLCDNNSSLAK